MCRHAGSSRVLYIQTYPARRVAEPLVHADSEQDDETPLRNLSSAEPREPLSQIEVAASQVDIAALRLNQAAAEKKKRAESRRKENAQMETGGNAQQQQQAFLLLLRVRVFFFFLSY